MLKAVATLDAQSSTRDCNPAKGEECMVHDGKRIIVRHGPEAVTGCGNPAYMMLCGAPKDLDVEVARLKLQTAEAVAAAELEPAQKEIAK